MSGGSNKTKLWQKGYTVNKQVEEFTVGNDYLLDQKLIKYDCIASIAHAKMLGKINILTADEVNRLERELQHIIQLSEQGTFKIRQEQEDCHTAIENHLTETLGDLGGKIHTARSRNDQVLTALRLYYKDELAACRSLMESFISKLRIFINKFGVIHLPGFTHTRKAMPTSIAVWAESFVDSMEDNILLFDSVSQLIDQSPLGTGAGYGIPLEIDREYTSQLMGFKKVQQNPIYCQNSRGKFESSILHLFTQIMYDVNKLASDLIMFSMPEFGFFELLVELCTGSSIMPHKKNPDVLELLRAQYHTVLALEIQIKNTTINLISGYHRDIQLTKEPVIKGFEITRESLKILNLIFDELKVNEQNCENALTDELFTTAEVYKLVQQGIPFRKAYQMVAQRYHK